MFIGDLKVAGAYNDHPPLSTENLPTTVAENARQRQVQGMLLFFLEFTEDLEDNSA